jgi:hypothetical protein
LRKMRATFRRKVAALRRAFGDIASRDNSSVTGIRVHRDRGWTNSATNESPFSSYPPSAIAHPRSAPRVFNG